ncbi:hypothetical protein T10_4345 [Trichinella papuae]|uniref:Uncharacterized protein n=1 Tax=Trichinella papuae TaxID=268474 RepID=A0A0V1N1N9_9BILA|nr:hypothetical protein T10_4345 [Trichinella papuae]
MLTEILLDYNIDESVISTRPHKFVVLQTEDRKLATCDYINSAVYNSMMNTQLVHKQHIQIFTGSTGIKIQIDHMKNDLQVILTVRNNS